MVSDQSIQRDPTIKVLLEEIHSIKDEIINTLAEYDDIRLQLNPQIEADYSLKIGCYDNELLKSNISARRVKRKYALLLQAINSGNKPDISEIEIQLDSELFEWEEKLKEAYCRYQQLLDYRNNSTRLNEKDAKELSKLYRQIVKRLHPDINPNTTEREQQLLLAAQISYSRGDLLELRAIAVTVNGLEERLSGFPEDIDTKSLLETEVSMLRVTLENIEERLSGIKSEFPFCYQDNLLDKDWVEKEVQVLEEKIELNKSIADDYSKRIESLMRNTHG